MLGTAIILFVIAAIFGLVILTAVLKNQPTPKKAVFTHGPLAALALILVIYYVVTSHRDPLLTASIVLFMLAAGGGLAMFIRDMLNKPIPKFVAIVHPIFAVSGLITLIVHVLK